jgi:lipopolysaccharide exporter
MTTPAMAALAGGVVTDHAPVRSSKIPHLGARVASGVRWNLVDQLVQQTMRIGISIALARLLLPHDFGIAALAFVVSDLAKVFGDIGIAPALVYVRELRPAHVRTALTTGLVTGIAATAVIAVGADSLAGFFRQAEVRPVLMTMSLTFVLKGLVAPVQSLWRRDLTFRPFVISNSIAVGVAGTAAVVVAAYGAGVWALVTYALGESVVGLISAYAIVLHEGRHRVTFGFERSAFRELAGFGAFVSGSRICVYGRQNLDNVIVGRFLGATALGFYDFAYNLMLYPIQRLSSVVSSVSYPAFAQLRDEGQRMAQGFTRALRMICVVTFPITVASSVAASLYVPLVFGERWIPAVTTVQVLALNGVRLSMTSLNGTIMESSGRPGWNLILNVGILALAVPGFLIAVPFGITAVALAFTAAGALSLPVSMQLAARRAHTPVRAQLRAVRVPAVASIGMALVMLGLMAVTRHVVTRFTELVVIVIAGGSFYLLTVRWLDPSLLMDAVATVRRAPMKRTTRRCAMDESMLSEAQPLPPITKMSAATAAQWTLLGAVQRREPPGERVLALLRLIDGHHDGFAVSQLTHCLQVATRAERAGADDEMIIAALCHDVGKVIPHTDHGAVAAAMLRPHVRPDVSEIIRTHSAFQRRFTHAYLGGRAEARRRYRRQAWFADAEQFCDWDQASFDPNYNALPLEHFEIRLLRVFGTQYPPAKPHLASRLSKRLARLSRTLTGAVGRG